MRREAMRKAEKRQKRIAHRAQRRHRGRDRGGRLRGAQDRPGRRLVELDAAVTCANVKARKGTSQQFASPPDDDRRPDLALRRPDGHELRHHHDRSRRDPLPGGRQQLRVPGAAEVLRRPRLHPGGQGLRDPGRQPRQPGAGGPGYSVVGELPTASPPYPVGAVAMAKTGADPAGTAGSQFFVATGANAKSLTADYAYIGQVTKGLDVAKKIMSSRRPSSSGDGHQRRTPPRRSRSTR